MMFRCSLWTLFIYKYIKYFFLGGLAFMLKIHFAFPRFLSYVLTAKLCSVSVSAIIADDVAIEYVYFSLKNLLGLIGQRSSSEVLRNRICYDCLLVIVWLIIRASYGHRIWRGSTLNGDTLHCIRINLIGRCVTFNRIVELVFRLPMRSPITISKSNKFWIYLRTKEIPITDTSKNIKNRACIA